MSPCGSNCGAGAGGNSWAAQVTCEGAPQPGQRTKRPPALDAHTRSPLGPRIIGEIHRERRINDKMGGCVISIVLPTGTFVRSQSASSAALPAPATLTSPSRGEVLMARGTHGPKGPPCLRPPM